MSTDIEIVRLDPRLHVRKRPGMYIGGVDARALHHLVYEIVDVSVEAALVNECNHIEIILQPKNQVTIRDNGNGLSVAPMSVESIGESGKTRLEYVMTVIGKDASDHYPIYGSLHGVGLSAVNALSALMRVEVRRDGYLWSQAYREGTAQSAVVQERPLAVGESTGTSFTFTPDFTILEPNNFNYDRLVVRSRELAYLVKGLRISVRDERITSPHEREFHSDGGLSDFVKELNTYQEVLHEPIHSTRQLVVEREGKAPSKFIIDFAFQYTRSTNTNKYSYVNTVQTTEGGTHVDALLTGIAKAVTAYVRRHEPDRLKPRSRISTKQILCGLTFVVSILHPTPNFMSPTKVQLFHPEVFKGTRDFVYEVVLDYLEANPEAAGVIIRRR